MAKKKSFDEVFTEELNHLGKSVDDNEDANESASKHSLLGLAFSGGGVRSATFNLGVLQALAQALPNGELLSKVDYLSTVSGGGYIGAWFTAMQDSVRKLFEAETERLSKDNPPREIDPEEKFGFHTAVANVLKSPGGEPGIAEHAALKWLRRFSNYLTPRTGLMSADTWTAIVIYLRNLMLNFVVFVLFFAAVLTIPRVFNVIADLPIFAFDWHGAPLPWNSPVGLILFALSLIAIAVAYCVHEFYDRFTDNSRYFSIAIVVSVVLVSAMMTLWLPELSEAEDVSHQWILYTSLTTALGWFIAYIAFCAFGIYKATEDADEAHAAPATPQPCASSNGGLRFLGWAALTGIAVGAALGVPLQLISEFLHDLPQLFQRMMIGVPLMLVWFCVSVGFTLGFSGYRKGLGGEDGEPNPQAMIDWIALEGVREWLTRIGAWLIIIASVWAGLFAMSYWGPYLLSQFDFTVASGSLVWIVTTVAGLVAGREAAAATPGRTMRLIIKISPYVFFLGFMLLIASGLNATLAWTHYKLHTDETSLSDYETWSTFREAVACARDTGNRCMSSVNESPDCADGESAKCLESEIAEPRESSESDSLFKPGGDEDAPGMSKADDEMSVSVARYGQILDPEISSHYYDLIEEIEAYPWTVPGVFFALLFVALAFSFCVGINEFTLHRFYANRLTRCYLGGAQEFLQSRCKRSISSSNDERNVNRWTGFSIADDIPLSSIKHERPYHLINTAVNLTASKELAWQERQAASFVLSPLNCGFAPSPGHKGLYYSAKHFAGGLSLGESIATSGAAASPNMGFRTTGALAFMLAVFNIRLGRWVGNPDYIGAVTRPKPRMPLLLLLKEAFMATNAASPYLYLSDGGHFENLGIYELVRRRCRYIIACDAGADPDLKFEDLGNAIRKCRIDLNAEISIDVSQIRALDENGASDWHCALGRISYDKDNFGYLLYIKASIPKNAPEDIREYAKAHTDFPHETTADQFFSESQFESYRKLGFHVTNEVIMAALNDVRKQSQQAGTVNTAPDSDASIPNLLERLFTELRKRWYPPSPNVGEKFERLTARLDALNERLRTCSELSALTPAFYTEWRAVDRAYDVSLTWMPESIEEKRSAFHYCQALIALMENAYIDLDLDNNADHPDNRGWMNLFRHWSWTSMFRFTWAISASTYGARFQTFCERELDLKLGRVSVSRVDEEDLKTLRSLGDVSNVDELKALSGDVTFNVVEREHLQKILNGVNNSLSVFQVMIEATSPTSNDDSLLKVNFGYAVLDRDGKTARLLAYRIQDHLRQMGLGRTGLVELFGWVAESDQLTDISYSAELVEKTLGDIFPEINSGAFHRRLHRLLESARRSAPSDRS